MRTPKVERLVNPTDSAELAVVGDTAVAVIAVVDAEGDSRECNRRQ